MHVPDIFQCFKGFAANGDLDSPGGGINYQCLPLNPQFDSYNIPSVGYYSVMSGTEYQNHEYPSSLPRGTHDHNVPCAKCHTARGSLTMIPGWKDCPRGWVQQYNGELFQIFSTNCCVVVRLGGHMQSSMEIINLTTISSQPIHGYCP